MNYTIRTGLSHWFQNTFCYCSKSNIKFAIVKKHAKKWCFFYIELYKNSGYIIAFFTFYARIFMSVSHEPTVINAQKFVVYLQIQFYIWWILLKLIYLKLICQYLPITNNKSVLTIFNKTRHWFKKCFLENVFNGNIWKLMILCKKNKIPARRNWKK